MFDFESLAGNACSKPPALGEEPFAPRDFYHTALKCAIKRREKHPEVVAALMAAITEALADSASPAVRAPAGDISRS